MTRTAGPSQPRSAGRDKMPLASLVLGITGIVLFFFLIPAATALVLGTIAVRNAKETPGQPGLRMAQTGMALGALGVGIFAVAAVATALDALG